MKLSKITGEHTLDVVANLIDPVANIAADPRAAELFRREKLPKGKSVNEFLLERVRKSVPSLLTTHKRDIIAILSTVEGVSSEQYAAGLTLPKLFHDVMDLLADEDFVAIFTSAQTGTSSGSAQLNTAAR